MQKSPIKNRTTRWTRRKRQISQEYKRTDNGKFHDCYIYQPYMGGNGSNHLAAKFRQ